jgi:hypothetical protein
MDGSKPKSKEMWHTINKDNENRVIVNSNPTKPRILAQAINPAPGNISPTAAARILGCSTNNGRRKISNAVIVRASHRRKVRDW